MLLGLPYGFNDIHFGPITETLAYTLGSADHRFILRCVLCAGKVIDRNIAPGTPSFAKAMELDEEMDTIAACMPTVWWNIPDESTTGAAPTAVLLLPRQDVHSFTVSGEVVVCSICL
jgi:hypothetical protein